MADTFRDALSAAIRNKSALENWNHADAVLASDEMQGLRSALRALHEYGGPNYLEYLEIPESVIAWVLDDPSPDSPPPADKPCETCKGLGCTCPGYCERADDHVCPSCRGGEPT